jgi:hypothetical protein
MSSSTPPADSSPIPAIPQGVPLALQAAGASATALYAAPEAGGNILTVGAGEEYATLSAAIAASHDGDIIKVDAGTYTNDTATVNTKITIEGVGGMVNLVETADLANQKGILIVNNDVTIANISFSGAQVTESQGANGAGVRYQGGNLTLINDVFTNNQDGLAAWPVDGLPVNAVTIDHCTFSGNGVGDPSSPGYGYTHNAYIGAVDKLTVTNSVFENVSGTGHELKSRAYVNDIEDNVISDGTSTASYSIDLPNGGVDTVAANYIEQGPNSPNGAIIHFGGEGFPYANSSLTVDGNTIINDDKSSNAVGVLNQTIIAATVAHNTFTGLAAAKIASGPVKATGNVDGQGNPLADSTSNQLLPTNFQVFADGAPHTVTLSQSNSGVEGGGGLLTVNDIAGHVTVVGGPGGLNFTEAQGAGGSTVVTAKGSTNTVILSGQTSVDSEGTDTITVGHGNATLLVNGVARISSGPGSNTYTVNGIAQVVGNGGNDFISVGQDGRLTVTGHENYLQVTEVGGAFDVDATIAGLLEQVSVSGGSMQVRSYGGALNFTTSGGKEGATIRLGAGNMNVLSHAADVIHAGSGDDMLQLSVGGQVVYAGTGNLAIYGRSIGSGNNAIVYGAGGDYRFGGDTGNITYIGGDQASTIEAAVSNLTIIGGEGHLTINGGSRDTITGGTGGITLNGGAADTITTAIGSTNTLTLNGADHVYSWGNDLINADSHNHTLVLHGNATVMGAAGSNYVTMLGTDTLLAIGGTDTVAVGAGANATVRSAAWTSLSETGATVTYTADAAGDNSTATVIGGSAGITSSANHALTVTTKAGFGTEVDLGVGKAVVTTRGADTIRAGSGAVAVNVGGDGVRIVGSTGALTVNDQDWAAGHNFTLEGGAGNVVINGGGPSKITFIGGSGDAMIHGGYNILAVTAGSGNITLNGGSGGSLLFVAGSGTANLSISTSGGTVEFGSGNTTATEAKWGAKDIFRFTAGHGGGNDIINGFRGQTDKLVFDGVSVTSRQASGGSTYLTLSDNTHVQMMGITNLGAVG